MYVTDGGKTRNQFGGNVTWVRIPPSAPKQQDTLKQGVLLFWPVKREGFEGRERKRRSAAFARPGERQSAAAQALRGQRWRLGKLMRRGLTFACTGIEQELE